MRAKLKTWLKEETDFLTENFEHGERKLITDKLSRSWYSILAKGERLGMKRKIRINIGKKNGQWRGGVNGDYYRRIAFEKFPHRCNICGSKEKLQVHHIDRNRQNNHIANLQILCPRCHVILHQELRGWSREFDRCQMCGTKEIKHNAKGLCVKCYGKVFQKSQKHRYSKPNKKYQPGTRWKRK